MITLNGIQKSYGGNVLLEDVSFPVGRRERVGLVGRNGHGKTTLFKIIVGEESADAGEVLVPRRYRIGRLEQHIHFTEPTVVAEASLGLPAERRDETWVAEKVLAGLGFSKEDMERPPSVFSGGYQVRLNLAKLLVSEPDLLLLDEPTNYLDVVSIRWLSRFLREWHAELMLITHDRSFMDSVVTHTVAIHRKRAKKIEGDTGKLYTQILQEEEIYEKTRANDEKKRKQIERFVERFRAKNTLATRVQSRVKYLEKHKALDKLDTIQTLDFSFNAAPFPGKVLMRCEDLSFNYDGGSTLFKDLTFEIAQHDRICVIGPNGRGKSTLLRLLAGELEPRTGEIKPHPKVETGYFAQTNLETLNPANDVVTEIQSATAGCLPQTARNVAGAMMFEGDDALKSISILSGGEKSRVMLGKLIVSPFNLLLLDEPTNHLDMDSCDSLLAAVDAFDGAVVMVTHNEMFLHSLATRFVVFDRGRARMYEHSYHDFLDTVGWEMDESLGARTVKTKAKPSLDKKAMRQARARITQERSKALGPLEARVKDLETRIESLEAELEGTLADMEKSSMSGDAAALAEQARRQHELQTSIERAYDGLENATQSLEKKQRDFDRRLSELD